MNRDLVLGDFLLSYPPLDELTVAQAVQKEREGWGFVTWWDQANGFQPASIHTPDVTPIAQFIPNLQTFFDPAVVITRAAERTTNLKFLYGVIDSVRRSPFIVAQTMLSLDHATHGRTITVAGAGELKQMKPYGHSRVGSSDKLHDMVHICKLLTTRSDPVSYRGRVYSLDRALMALEPYSDTPPPLWVAGSTEDDLRLVGELADGWITLPPSFCNRDPELFARQVNTIREHAERAGRDPDGIAICAGFMCLIHDDPEELNRLRDNPYIRWYGFMFMPNTNLLYEHGLEHPMGRDWMYARKCVPYWLSREEAMDLINRTPREAIDVVFHTGSTTDVMNQIQPYLDAGVTHTMFFNGGLAAGADDHMPKLRALLTEPAAASPKH
jgi:phthiodiolone/phenolphthiodiolone dimycocerosates ketoreductase